MCGVAGFWQPGSTDDGAILRARAGAMADTLVHRGPDDAGTWAEASRGIAFGHRRLSIIDLSREGAQPMKSASGRYVLAFNGEIYNYRELRREIESASTEVSWRGNSDTEVMLAAIERWGVERALTRLQGMFALCIWDGIENVLHLARDRVGEKPLYYGWANRVLLFGSELKALARHPAWQGEIDRDAVLQFMRLAYVPAPRSIYRGIGKLLPGTLASFALDSLRAGEPPRLVRYWSLEQAAYEALDHPVSDERAAVDELEFLLRQAVRRQMVADVPLGAFLSGGVDSSTVVALMQAQSLDPVRTFCIGFRESHFDEAIHARAVANHLGTDHHEIYVSAEDALEVVPQLPRMYDEPFGDSSQIPTHLVARLARQQVTVSLSGDGGDELFCGYERYRLANRVRLAASALPPGAAAMLGAIQRIIPPGPFAIRVQKLTRALRSGTEEGIYRELISQWSDPAALVTHPPAHDAGLNWEAEGRLTDFASRMMFHDTKTYLPDDILVKLDRAAMAVGLETRVPLLDHRVVEFSWRLPAAMKCRRGISKWALRQVLYRYVPRKLIERPKMGFGIPIHSWLRGPMREWAGGLLAEDRLLREGLLNPRAVRVRWQEFLEGRGNWQYGLWNVLMLQAWLEAHRAS